jgi:hypothetical protein
MTDGDATQGSQDVRYLSTLVNAHITNTFIAFGLNHNATMMHTFGKVSPKCSNWLIERLENAGLVYGEVINNELYIGADNVTITMSNGTIYDYSKNTFVETLNVNTLVTETTKHYHISTSNPSECFATIRGTNSKTCTPFEERVYMLPDMESFATGEIFPNDLTVHMFRLRAQQLMYKVLSENKFEPLSQRYSNIPQQNTPRITRQNSVFRRQNAYTGVRITTHLHLENEDDNSSGSSTDTQVPMYEDEDLTGTRVRPTIKQELLDFQRALSGYITANGLENDDFLKNICEDINISLLTMNSGNQYMYVSARQSSQGRQQTYNVTDIELDDRGSFDDSTLQRFTMSRTTTNASNATPTVMRTMTQMSQMSHT